MYQPLAESQKEVVKDVLFGKQKQANVINDGVVAIVGRGIAEATSGDAALSSELNFVDAVQSFLQTSVDNGKPVNAMILMLLGGEESLLCLQEEGPKTIICESAGPDTPKYRFGICMLGASPEPSPKSLGMGTGSFDGMMNPPESAPVGEFKPEDMSYTAQRDFLIKAIVPLVPEAVKEELSSPVEQALVGSQWYFKHN